MKIMAKTYVLLGLVAAVAVQAMAQLPVPVDSEFPSRVEANLIDTIAENIELVSCPHRIRVISKDSLDFVLPEDEFRRAQQQIEYLQGNYFKLKNIEICRIKYLLDCEIAMRKRNPSIYGTPALELGSYARQYFGYKHNGHRLVFINLTSKSIWPEGFDDFDKCLKTLIVRDAPQVSARAIIDLDTEGVVFFSLGY